MIGWVCQILILNILLYIRRFRIFMDFCIIVQKLVFQFKEGLLAVTGSGIACFFQKREIGCQFLVDQRVFKGNGKTFRSNCPIQVFVIMEFHIKLFIHLKNEGQDIRCRMDVKIHKNIDADPQCP